MKLRLRGNTLRLRLTRSEVERAARGEPVREQVDLPGRALAYELCSTDAQSVEARFDTTREVFVVRVSVPRATVHAWANSETVGIAATSGQLSVLVEKDWQCLTADNSGDGHGRHPDDDRDTFPHPSAGKAGAKC